MTGNVTLRHTYLLCYCVGGKERIFDTLRAEGYQLVFKGVPSGALCIFHDLTAGTEERVFSVENGEVTWY